MCVYSWIRFTDITSAVVKILRVLHYITFQATSLEFNQVFENIQASKCTELCILLLYVKLYSPHLPPSSIIHFFLPPHCPNGAISTSASASEVTTLLLLTAATMEL